MTHLPCEGPELFIHGFVVLVTKKIAPAHYVQLSLFVRRGILVIQIDGAFS